MDPRSQPKILYIEDTADARALVSRVLSRHYIVLEAAEPLGGIELALDTHPDLILLDMNLPQLNGSELAARLKTLLPNTPLVAFSADTSVEARQRALAAGCIGYLTKPIDIDVFVEQIGEFLGGKRESLPNAAIHQQQFASDLVARLEGKVRELTRTADRNAFLNEQNQRLIGALQRRQRLLEAAARVSHIITSILDLDELLRVTVDVICEEYTLYFAAIYLLSADQKQAALRAGRGELGNSLLAQGYSLDISDQSAVGRSIMQRAAQITRQVSDGSLASVELLDFADLPSLSELALPLIIKGTVLGALSFYSDQPEAFSEEDMPALQALADQVAVAIDNAHLLRDLECANQELLRVKTFEAIAAATGEAIHWVGNKAAPIPGSARRAREDILALAQIFCNLTAGGELSSHPLWPAWKRVIPTIPMEIPASTIELLSLESILEDLIIIEQSAQTILDVKEDLIGPARLKHIAEIDLPALLQQTIFEMALPPGVVQLRQAASLPHLRGDARQLSQLFNNLIKNAWEALYGFAEPKIVVTARLSDDPHYVQVDVTDNGPGIAPEMLQRIWVSFFTTKAARGGTGLGLPACMSIVNQHEGKLFVESTVGAGATFRVLLPAP